MFGFLRWFWYSGSFPFSNDGGGVCATVSLTPRVTANSLLEAC